MERVRRKAKDVMEIIDEMTEIILSYVENIEQEWNRIIEKEDDNE